ncbi:MAG: porin [Flavobacteriales bacterium]|nr:porin [Flavobacteriales bacterium]
MKILYLILGLCISFISGSFLFSQVSNTGLMDTTSGLKIGNVSLGVYVDAYYAFNFNQPISGENNYFVSSNQHNSFQLNLGYLDLKYTDKRVRARFTPAFGTYMNENYSNEKGALKFILEGNIGVKLFKKKDIWLDAGVLGSPYTNESAISKDHLMYSRSFSAENVPYYLSGIKLSIPLSEKLTFYGYLLNGWQQIYDVNKQKSLGTQLEFRPNKNNLFNWDTYIGNEKSSFNPTYGMRYFSDIYWIFEKGKWKITSCAYAGIQEYSAFSGQKESKLWWQANLIGRRQINEDWSVSGRIEYFNDAENAIVPVQIANYTNNSFQCWSSGLSFAYKFSEKCLFRLEGRYFKTANNAFEKANGTRVSDEFQLFANLSVWF